ncbi:MAG: hypothetical protein KO464_01130 [Candidatus Methanofastidiosum sp.]|nr:hypothetical protein [Methanofastidiosum sp.]
MVFSPKGKTLAQKDLVNYKKYEKIIMVCGRFEGVDQRIIDYIADEEISVGNYVLAGGEIPAMIVTEGITRLLPNVLGNQKSLEEESFKEDGFLEYPQYTRPAKFKPARAKKI